LYVITTTTTDDKTAIRIEFDDDARQEAIRASRPGESMLERCCWRLIYNRDEEIEQAKDDSVTLRVDRSEASELYLAVAGSRRAVELTSKDNGEHRGEGKIRSQ
jgi:hypothetical protein